MQYDASVGSASRGRLIFLVGPSGSGKDSLIDAARERLRAHRVEIARRVITRSPESKGESAHGVSQEHFDELRSSGAFALDWQANGLCYGIPAGIEDWLAQGRSVLVNGSRGYLAQARARYPDLLAVGLVVDQQALRHRLLARGRESQDEIEQRLARNGRLQVYDGSVRVLDNSGALTDAVEAFLALLDKEDVIDLSVEKI
ncbi:MULTISPECIES: phosphonate metabolism protein/1,5-bisphosphokinase (PRPP-forming) PhnN [unclassified Pseudomonas]|uniref:phosphonate metabolism protein/1,5-bisphosphokinase (PRPP-forming) PhnN n=1 Tax=unclassified Pseudomonas TaxID=196821 RepID=UPI002447B4A3|nr:MULTISPECIES: phosphonate metabolism protein/1,5-bisphosphokinase (PRPP-forming) PhnN [unclassified Pseudomonas]MDH0300344.1 phosphonate metabolism protein/1,5-bisphosphokinase (PRPP-forming) PhnN [Pseudomonas sp. GD04091]MDH1986086.1 phosphonate metabolism protein/1,5-bisphosphokinase (PRPP-forming) PhnN [Pseudomonas sp. GD03689]